MNGIDYKKSNYGTVTFKGGKYDLTDQAEHTSRLLPYPPNYQNPNDDGAYLFEMSAPAKDEQGNDCTVYWIFMSAFDDDGDPAELDTYDYDDIDRVEMN